MIRTLFLLLLIMSVAAAGFAKTPYVVVLGIAQDAGAPQIGCASPFCERAWNDTAERKFVSSIALVDPGTGNRWIFDATPDLPYQFQLLKSVTGDSSNSIAGIFLTHAHIGHYTGLMYLGRESMNTRGVNVYAMPRMQTLLERNAPWSQLVDLENIRIVPLSTTEAVKLPGGLTVEPFLVPHRDEFSETVGYRIASQTKSLMYIPDIDKWEKWDRRLREVVIENDLLLVDGTFYADGEIPRPMSEVPHPFVTETMDLLKSLPRSERNKIHFIHLNHSNPLVQGNADKIAEVCSRGFNVAGQGGVFGL